MKRGRPQLPRYRRPPPLKKRRQSAIDLSHFRAESRRTLYEVLRVEHAGKVPCFCCGKHVPPLDATLEHVIPLSRGGRDVLGNYAISHSACNQRRGAPEVYV
jgi:5-methylcytosine-specific restriction endonuclease McrA